MKQKASRSPLVGRTVIVGVSGSIAAYKACILVRELIKGGACVHVLMTPNAAAFVTPLTFQTLSRNPVATGMFDQVEDWVPGHVALADKADALVVAPATANVLAKMACGIADDALTSTALAFRGPVVVAPAMNSGMFSHPATKANLATLRARGVVVVEPGKGDLACGCTGPGRLADIPLVVAAVISSVQRGARRKGPQ